MADEVRADPEAIAGLARATLAGSDDMSACWSAAQPVVVPPEAAFGDTAAGRALAAASRNAATATDSTWRSLVTVYEGDADRLYRVAFAYREADLTAAAQQRRAHHGRPDLP